MPTHSVKSWLHHKPGNLSMAVCQTVISLEVNCFRRNPTETGTCWVFARASDYLPASMHRTLLVPLICDPHGLSPSEGCSPSHIPKPLWLPAHRLPLSSSKVLREQTSTWTLHVLTPNSTGFCWLSQSWLCACWVLVQMVAAAQENHLKSPGGLGKSISSNYSL